MTTKFARARQALNLIGCPVNDEGCQYTSADFIAQFAAILDEALAVAGACCRSDPDHAAS